MSQSRIPKNGIKRDTVSLEMTFAPTANGKFQIEQPEALQSIFAMQQQAKGDVSFILGNNIEPTADSITFFNNKPTDSAAEKKPLFPTKRRDAR